MTSASANTPPSIVDSGPTVDNLASIFDASTRTRRGLCPIVEGVAESHQLYFEVHGKGPVKVLFVMGLNNTCFGWSWQIQHFAKDPRYSLLVFDNRGVGNSSGPRGPYTTLGMAQDTVALLNRLGWTDERSLHIVGVSMGGMLSQHLALLIPERIISLTLTVTTPGNPWVPNFPPWTGLKTMLRLFTIKNPSERTHHVLPMLYPPAYLAQDDPLNPGKKRKEAQLEDLLRRAAITRPQPLASGLSQSFAALRHWVPPEDLAKIARDVPKILIVTGTDDNLVDPSNSFRLRTAMPGSELVVFDGGGHAVHAQESGEFNKLLEKTWKEGEERLKEGKW